MNTRIIASLMLTTALLLAAGCADNSAKGTAAGAAAQRADILKAWKQASRQPLTPAEAADAKPLPEPKLAPMTRFSAAALYETQGHYDQAVEQYKKAIELNPAFGSAYGRLGLCYTKMGQLQLAVEALTKASSLEPKSVPTWNNLGFACLIKGDAVAAEAAFAKALQINPTYPRARTNMAMALVRQHRDDQALSNLQAVYPEHIALYNLGSMELAAGRDQQARSSFEKALALRPQFPAASRGLEKAAARLAMAPASQPAAESQSQQTARATATRPATEVALNGSASNPVLDKSSDPNAPAAAPATRPATADALGSSRKTKACPPVHLYEFLTGQASSTTGLSASVKGDSQLNTITLPSLADAAQEQDQATAAGRALATSVRAGHGPQAHGQAVSVADVDLLSLQCFAWREAMMVLHVDVRAVPDNRLESVMRKWLKTLEQLEDSTRMYSRSVAMADRQRMIAASSLLSF